jgi:hypothetical protein
MREVTNSQFSAIRETLTANEHATKQVPISAIKLTERSFALNQIEIGGQPVKVSSGFFLRMASMLKMNASLTREFIKNDNGKVAAAMMNALNDYRRSAGGKDILIIANPNTREVIDICDPKRYRRLTNESLFDMTEKIMNEHPSLIIETIDASPSGGSATINFLNSEEVGFPGAGKDEFFKFGFSIIQTSKDTIVETYNTRLVCSNGMRVSFGSGAIGGNRDLHFEEKFRLAGTEADDIRTFLNRVDAMKKAGFVPGGFNSAIQSAIGTRASLAEVEDAMMLAQRKVREDDPQFKKAFIESIERNYFGGHAETMARIAQKGMDPYKLNDKQKSFIKTGQSVWDVVNSLTYLGSNNSGIELENKYELKAEAGDLFAKGTNAGFDLQFAQYAQL